MNRLQDEASPYLRQHADNPVDWFPWSDEAFQVAKERDLPVFLSIGYSSCHWCHVMEEESFEDEDIADLINQHFIPIKVDREERPDIDSVYMEVCQRLTGQGGWPLTLFLTPDKKPFFAATYLPARGGYGHRGLMDIIPEVARSWNREREKIYNISEEIMKNMVEKQQDMSRAMPNSGLINQAYNHLKSMYDHQYGGFGESPKFPMVTNLRFLLYYWHIYGDGQALEMVETTLAYLRQGGVYDQLGFGFHRYAVDRAWTTPHFEKMLYDQAQLLFVYTEAYQVTSKEIYARVARELISYLKRVLLDESGGFYTAEDADSEGKEGKFYLWDKSELKEILNSREYQQALDVFRVEKDRGNILQLSALGDVGRVENLREKLLGIREDRKHPFRDDKVLTDWNGLTMAALARAGRVLEDDQSLKLARGIAGFIDRYQADSGRLFHSYRQGEITGKETLDDYSFLLWGLLELHQATLDREFLLRAERTAEYMLENYRDSGGGFFMSPAGEELPLNQKKVFDGALPSGNSLAATGLYSLFQLTGNNKYQEATRETLEWAAPQLEQNPVSHLQLLMVLDFYNRPFSRITIEGGDSGFKEKLRSALGRRFYPDVLIAEGQAESKPSAVICRGNSCSLPITGVEAVLKEIKENKDLKGF